MTFSAVVNYVSPTGAYSEPGTMNVNVNYTINPVSASSPRVVVAKYIVFLAEESRLLTEQFVSGNMEMLTQLTDPTGSPTIAGIFNITGKISYAGIPDGLKVSVIVQLTFENGFTTLYSDPSMYDNNGAAVDHMFTPPAAPVIPAQGAQRVTTTTGDILIVDPLNPDVLYYYVILQYYDSFGNFQATTQQLQAEPTVIPSPYKVISNIDLGTTSAVAVAVQACIPYPVESNILNAQFQASSPISNTEVFIESIAPSPPTDLQMTRENSGVEPLVEPLSFNLSWTASVFSQLRADASPIAYKIEKSYDGIVFELDGTTEETVYTTSGNADHVGEQVYYRVTAVDLVTGLESPSSNVVESIVFGRANPALSLFAQALQSDSVDKQIYITWSGPNSKASLFSEFYGYGHPGQLPSGQRAWKVTILQDGLPAEVALVDYIPVDGTLPYSQYSYTTDPLPRGFTYEVVVECLTLIGDYPGQTEMTDLPPQYPFVGLPATTSVLLEEVPIFIEAEYVVPVVDNVYQLKVILNANTTFNNGNVGTNNYVAWTNREHTASIQVYYDDQLVSANEIATPSGFIGKTWEFLLTVPPELLTSSTSEGVQFLLNASNVAGIGEVNSPGYFFQT
jgi:hypothetical protein